eukprot:gene976-9883_t
MKKQKVVGVDDMVLLTKITPEAVHDNLKARHVADQIYTYIGNVLISINPYKRLPISGPEHVEMYKGRFAHELPPHIFALAERAYKGMLNDGQDQCVIISGESGAGKTEASKLIMQYIAAVSGKSEGVEKIKKVILESNPLLEAFGNAKTVRNNNSSRFGKYMEIMFDRKGDPVGGRVTNYLLEKSRVVFQQKKERNFHIFYQIIAGASSQQKEDYGLEEPKYFHYLNQSGCFDVENIDDKKEFQETQQAMDFIGFTKENQEEIFRLLAGILWLGNVSFLEKDGKAQVEDSTVIEFASYLLGIDATALEQFLCFRLIQTRGGHGSLIRSPQTSAQAGLIRDSLSKALYDRLFNYIVLKINAAMVSKQSDLVSINVLDIYGFEIFDKNGFEQFCINYVNEKLQQIFIELTLKAEQEEYAKEGIKWEPIKFFNNKIVCDLIEARKPPGIMSLLDDICATTKSMSAEQADGKFQQKLGDVFTSHPHLFSRGVSEFIIKHYAGEVSYNVTGFTEKNNDDLYDTLIETMKMSKCQFYAGLFPENVSSKNKKRPPTSGFKIKNSCSELVVALNKCVPHYIRCIKPNENKKPREMDTKRTVHQIQYLGLIENIRVRRAGFAYRTEYDNFLERFGLLSKLTWPNPWNGNAKDGCVALLNDLNIDEKEWQLGKTKMFLRHPETLFQLEDLKERKFHNAASLIQRKYKQYKLKEYFIELKNTVNDALYQKKERRALSLNKVYLSDYLQYTKNAQLQQVMKEYKNEGGVLFSDEYFKPVRKFMGHRVDKLSLLVTPKSINFIERVKEKKQFVTKVVYKLRIDDIQSISLSTLSDNFIVIHSKKQNTEEMFGENINKTELISVLFDQYRKLTNQDLQINFSDSIQYTSNAKGKKKVAAFIKDKSEKNKLAVLSGSSTKWTVSIASGLPSDSKPKPQEVKVKKQQKSNNTYKQKQVQEEPLGLGIMESVPTNQHVDRPKRPPPSLPKKKEAPKPQVKALFDYDAAADDEITIKEGDIINLIQKSETGWWEGELNGKTGLFPGTYVEHYQ